MNRMLGFAIVLAGALGAGCTVTTTPAVGYAEVSAAPVGVDITAYPYTYYEGRPVYLYNDRWYYRGTGGNWYYYRTEPRYLYDRRYRRDYYYPHGRTYEHHDYDRRYDNRYHH